MEFKGTRGKWKADTFTSENGRETTIVCNTEYNSDRTDIHIRFSAIDETEKETNKANALLISKSPEMLEMLKNHLEFLIYCRDNMKVSRPVFNQKALRVEKLIKEATDL